jgi:hypothetical protein
VSSNRGVGSSPYRFFAPSEIALTKIGECDAKISRGSTAMKKGNFAVGQHVRLKWALEAPTNIPVGAIGEVTRVSPWDVWVRFDKLVVRLPSSEVDHI